MAGIVLDRVAKVYDGNVRAVDSVDLTVADGEKDVTNAAPRDPSSA